MKRSLLKMTKRKLWTSTRDFGLFFSGENLLLLISKDKLTMMTPPSNPSGYYLLWKGCVHHCVDNISRRHFDFTLGWWDSHSPPTNQPTNHPSTILLPKIRVAIDSLEYLQEVLARIHRRIERGKCIKKRSDSLWWKAIFLPVNRLPVGMGLCGDSSRLPVVSDDTC